jgi:predicted metal-binding membrane protein
MSLLIHYTSFRGPAIDIRVGLHHGLYCVACCWGLMLILVAVGVMNILAMAVLEYCSCGGKQKVPQVRHQFDLRKSCAIQ